MKFCEKCLNPISEKNEFSIQVISEELLADPRDWIIGYSGGKDSSTVLALVLESLRRTRSDKTVTIVYCDTGVEIPLVNEYVYTVFNNLTEECKLFNINVQIKVAKPKLEDTFFVKVIGRGYPSPTNKFRWCTDRLRINPIKQMIPDDTNVTVLLGVRKGESIERDRTITKHSTDGIYRYKQVGNSNVSIFSPIIDYSTRDVWETLKHSKFPQSIDYQVLGELYRSAGAECPVIKDPKGSACGKGRFGCWTCTVVRQDSAVTLLIEQGYENLRPLLKFRNWLYLARDNPKFRCKKRRNLQPGLGPLTLSAREIILEKLLEAQNVSKIKLITQAEIDLIQELWKKDKNSMSYLHIEKCH
ncbi:DNA sulfur modification protein DndC [Lewinella aquimaris]|uniref:DNA sulfur modification protein DndC n=1 Tax=Neolewinella aquimaris TaxID=1835722 RepID=A0A840ECA1_9BACT|nr:phosphoadenosine phosphosulfate reductase family protein [Neolewinella aquimaris]MBB4081097.1 DNA sulfur modification protein DndC [Neolewinella aquimaris]